MKKLDTVYFQQHKPIRISWQGEIGFGEFVLYYDEYGVLHLDNEAMSRDTVKEAFGVLIDSAVLDIEE